MGQITIDQSHAIMAILAQNVDWEKIDFDAGLQDGIIRNPKEAGRQFALFLQGGGRVNVEFCSLTETDLPRPVTTTTIPARTEPFDPKQFYQTRLGLYVWGTFADRLDLRARQIVSSAPERSYVASLLKARACDLNIRKELPKNHLSTLEDIAALIEAQWGGKNGFLLNDGRANIFYVEGKNGEVFAVVVVWDADARTWSVSDWRLDENGDWDAGAQVLCPGNAVP